MTRALRSFSLSLALDEGHLNIDSALDASRLDIEHQIDLWGEVDEHSVDRNTQTNDISAALLLKHSLK